MPDTSCAGNVENSSMLALRGLPFSASSKDICDWFNTDAADLGISPITPDRWGWNIGAMSFTG